jgi:hypothetical protein
MNNFATFGSETSMESDWLSIELGNYEGDRDFSPPTLESLVEIEMRQNGFDPTDAGQVTNYWTAMLEPIQNKVYDIFDILPLRDTRAPILCDVPA